MCLKYWVNYRFFLLVKLSYKPIVKLKMSYGLLRFTLLT